MYVLLAESHARLNTTLHLQFLCSWRKHVWRPVGAHSVVLLHAVHHALQLPPSSRSGDNWIAREYTNAIKAQQNFELQLYVTPRQQQQQAAAPSSPGSPQPPPQGTLMQAQFRCAANTGIDNNMLPIGIPNFLPNEGDGARCFYFATLRELPRRKGQTGAQVARQPSGSSSSALLDGNSSRKQQQGHEVGQLQQGGGSGAQFSLMASTHDPMPDIKLGPLLGKGAFGRVYRGGFLSERWRLQCRAMLLAPIAICSHYWACRDSLLVE